MAGENCLVGYGPENIPPARLCPLLPGLNRQTRTEYISNFSPVQGQMCQCQTVQTNVNSDIPA